MKISWGLGAALLAGTTLLTASAAGAATEQDTMTVSATVTNNCALTVGSLAFSDIDMETGFNSADTDVSISCTSAPDAGATIAFDGGLYYGAAGGSLATYRAMKDASTHYLAYGLYRDVARTDAVAKDGTMPISEASATTVYGRVPKQTAVEGSYTDTVVVTLNYTITP